MTDGYKNRAMFTGERQVLTFEPIFLSISSTRTFCWTYISSGVFPGASSRFIPPAPGALQGPTRRKMRMNHPFMLLHSPIHSCCFIHPFTHAASFI